MLKIPRYLLVAALSLTSAVTMFPVTSFAQTPASEARAAFQEGLQHFSAQHFAEALVSFQRAYRTRPHPSVMVNIANCHLALDQQQEAIAWFERYLSEAGTLVSADQRAQIEQTIAEARQRLVLVTILAQPLGSEIFVDGVMVGVAPLRGPRQISAGSHLLEARSPNGTTTQHQAQFEAGRSITITLDTLHHRSYVGSVAPGTNENALNELARRPATSNQTDPLAPQTPITPPVVSHSTPQVIQSPVVQNVAPPPPLRITEPEVVTRRRSGFVPVLISGLALTVGGFATGLGVSLYNEQWISEYNQIVFLYDRDRTRNPGQAVRWYRQGTEHLDTIHRNETFATIGFVAGSIGAVATLATLLFWPRETFTSSQGPMVQLRVVPMLNGLALGGTF
jgi:hypothetical protein